MEMMANCDNNNFCFVFNKFHIFSTHTQAQGVCVWVEIEINKNIFLELKLIKFVIEMIKI